jgi:hypothetical protein
VASGQELGVRREIGIVGWLDNVPDGLGDNADSNDIAADGSSADAEDSTVFSDDRGTQMHKQHIELHQPDEGDFTMEDIETNDLHQDDMEVDAVDESDGITTNCSEHTLTVNDAHASQINQWGNTPHLPLFGRKSNPLRTFMSLST